MTEPRILVFGGTSDSLAVCAMLAERALPFVLSVATPAGLSAARDFAANVITGRLDVNGMTDVFQRHHIKLIIDAAHPYAAELHTNIAAAAAMSDLPVLAYERESDIDQIEDPLVIRVTDVAQACDAAQGLGHRVLLTTGSKCLAQYQRRLPDKHLIVRVLPTSQVMAECEQAGLQLDQIIAMKGPFSVELNKALYQAVAADVIITKESGQAGGYMEKIQPCLELSIPCIVIERPRTAVADNVIRLTTLNDLDHGVCRFFKDL